MICVVKSERIIHATRYTVPLFPNAVYHIVAVAPKLRSRVKLTSLYDKTMKRIAEDALAIVELALLHEKALAKHLSPNINCLVRVASEMTVLFSIPSVVALKAASRMLSIISRYGVLDDISKAIIEVLCVKDGISISELTRRVKEVRGRASRRVISGRLRILASSGIVVLERRGNRVLVKLNI